MPYLHSRPSLNIFALLSAAAVLIEAANATQTPVHQMLGVLQKRAGPRTSNCMILTNSATCPGQNGLVIAQTSAYRDTTSFDAFVNSRLDTNAAYVRAFQNDFGCPEYQGQGQQFHMSIFCALLTQQPIGCSQQDSQPRIPLCQDTCNLAVSSLSNFYQTTCISNQTSNALAERNVTISAYQSFCSELTIQNSQVSQCLNGSTQPQEATTCGFSSVDQGVSFCSSSSNSCCQNVPGANQSSPNGSSASSGSSGFSSSIIFIVLLALGILFFLIMLFLFFRWAMNRRQGDDDDDDEPLSPGMPVMAERPLSNTGISNYESNLPAPIFASNLPSGIDENFSIVQVIAPYESQMVDELTLAVNDQIQIFESYDDGWAYGKKIATGEVGTLPMICTAPLGGGAARESFANSSSYRQSSQFSISNYNSRQFSGSASKNLSQYTSTGNSSLPPQRSSYMPEQDLDSADAAFSS